MHTPTEKRVPIKPHYGDGRLLVAVLNLGGKNVPLDAIADEVAEGNRYNVHEPLRRIVRRGLLIVECARYAEMSYSLTDAGRAEAIAESPDVNEWVRRYLIKRESIVDIAADVGYHRKTVRRALTDAGVVIKGRGCGPHGSRPARGAK